MIWGYGDWQHCHINRFLYYPMVFHYIKVHLGIRKTVGKCHIIRCHINYSPIRLMVLQFCPAKIEPLSGLNHYPTMVTKTIIRLWLLSNPPFRSGPALNQ